MTSASEASVIRTLPGMSVEERIEFLETVLAGSIAYSIIAESLAGTILAWSEGARRIYGYEPRDVIGRAEAFILYDPEDVHGGFAQRTLDEARAVGKWSGELKQVRKDGSIFAALATITLRRDSDGKAVGFTTISRELTEAPRVRSELMKPQEYNRKLIESAVDALVAVDPDLTISDVNEQMVRMTRSARVGLIGSKFPDCFTEPDRAAAGVRKALAEGAVANYELILRSGSGRETTVSLNAGMFKDVDGHVAGIFAVMRDITEQKRLEEELHEQQHYNRSVIESSVGALIAVDLNSTITDINEQTEKLIGYSREELVGTPVFDWFTEPARAAAGAARVFEEGVITNYELVLRAKSGREVPVSFNAGVFRNTSGAAVGIIAGGRDVTTQKQFEQAMREQETYTRSLIESNIDALMTADIAGIITDVNRQMCAVAGRSREELIGTPFKAYFVDQQRAEEIVPKVLAEDRVLDYELAIRAKTGQETVLSYNASAFKDADGQLRGVLAAGRDVTAQKQLEEQARQQTDERFKRFRLAVEAAPNAMVLVDRGRRITLVNHRAEKLFGYGSDELLGHPLELLVPERVRERHPAHVRDFYVNPKVRPMGAGRELFGRRRDGSEVPIAIGLNPIETTDGLFTLASIIDITEQQQLEKQIQLQSHELRETTGVLNNVLESSTEYSIIAMDLEGTIQLWNEGARRNYGYNAEEMIGRRNARMLHIPVDAAAGRFEEMLRTALLTGKAEGTFERVRKNGTQFTASVGTTLRRDVTGGPAGFVLISKDITEQKRLESQLRHKNEELEQQNRQVQEATRLKSEFLANMSHELRTPLNAIIGFSEMIFDGKAGAVTPEQHDFLTDILSGGRHLLKLINDVLDLAKVESGRMDFFPEPIVVAKVVSEVRDLLWPLAASKQIEIRAEVDPALLEIVIDAAKLKQLFYNYLSNALKFTPEGGVVRIGLKAEGDNHLLVEVEDTGIGIAPEDLDRLFVEFQQLDAGSAKKYQGTGLGLALTKRLVEAQGGEVGVRSARGKGSTFWARLKRFNESSSIPSLVPEFIGRSSGDPSQPDVLVIEDDADDRACLLRNLTEGGFRPLAAATAAEGIAYAAKVKFDVITLDILLPDMASVQVMHAIRQSEFNHETPVVVVSVTNKQPSLAFPVQNWLTKPVGREPLLEALRTACHDHRPEHACVLVLDDDLGSLRLASHALKKHGYRPLCTTVGEEALQLAELEHPVAILLDLMMDEMDGFEFLRRLRLGSARNIPVIVWSGKTLDVSERASLLRATSKVVPKDGKNMKEIIQELRSYVVSPAAQN